MKKLLQNGLALLICSFMFFTMFDVSVFANEHEMANEPETEETNEVQIGNKEVIKEEEITEETSVVQEGDSSKVNYFYVGFPYLETPNEQEFVVSFGKGTENISSLMLIVEKQDGTIIKVENSNRVNELYHLKKSFTDDDSGVYTVKEIRYFIDDKEYKVDLFSLGINAQFGVNEEYDGYVAAYSDEIDREDFEIEESIVSLDSTNFYSADELVENKVDEILETTPSTLAGLDLSGKARVADEFVVALDPGHGGNESGTYTVNSSIDGKYEKDYTLKIAQYAKEELEQYKNVRVVMTRSTDVSMGLKERVDYAVSQGADIFVSIHLNGYNGQHVGAEVYYPNSNYRPDLGNEGQNLAQQIQNELTALGIYDRGIKIRNIEDGDDPLYDYPDGSHGDYYGVIRHSKKAGIAGIIVEHCFADNYSDFYNFLNSEGKLKNLGVADATGIAKAYGLSKVSREEVDQFASENRAAIADGVYEIQTSLNNDYVFEVTNGSMDNGATVQMYSANGSSAQLWEVSHDTKGYVILKNLNSNMVLDVSAGKANNGAVIQQYTFNDSYAQKWIVEKNDIGYIIYSAINPLYCLDVSGGTVANGTKLQLYVNNQSKAQNWIFGEPTELYQPFTDVTKKAWFYEAVKYVNENQIMTGLNATTFAPNDNLARAQFSTILYRMNESPEVEYKNIFPDIVDGQWYTNAILWASEAEVVTGYDNGFFGPSDNINREQMAVMLYRYAQYMNLDITTKGDISKFEDASKVNDFAKEAMQWAVANGIITGKDNGAKLDPQGSATRAECATIIMRFLEKL